MERTPVLHKVDAVTVPVPDLDSGLEFYHDALGHELSWRCDEIGQAGLRLPGGDTEIVLTTRQDYEPNWLVASADSAAEAIAAAGGRMVVEPCDIPVGRLAVVADPFGNVLVLVDLSKGRYVTDESGQVTGIEPAEALTRSFE
jgi:predicted enzyme related to lactoylglutathione lyase